MFVDIFLVLKTQVSFNLRKKYLHLRHSLFFISLFPLSIKSNALSLRGIGGLVVWVNSWEISLCYTAKMNQSSSISSESNCNNLFFKTVSLRYVPSDLTQGLLIAAGVLNFIACPFVCFLNALVMLAVKTKRRLQTHSNILLACLALTDLIVGVVVQPLHGTKTIFLLQGKGFNEFCGINFAFTVSFVVVSFASLSHLVLISGERYLTIKYSFTHNAVITKPRVIFSSAIAWIAAIIIFIFLSKSMFIPVAVFKITSLSLIICLQVLVYKKAKRHEKQILAQQVSVEANAKFKKEKKALKLTTLVILVIFLSFFLPTILVSVTWKILREKISDDVKTTVRHFSLAMVNLNSVINPVIYAVRIRHFRVAFIELLWRKRFHEAEESERKLFKSRHNVVRPKVRQEGEMIKQNVEGRNQIQPAAAACHEGTAGGFQISISTATVTANNDIKVVSPNTPANNASIESEGYPQYSEDLGKR